MFNLLLVITNMNNFSFESGEFATTWKEGLTATLEEKLLNINFKNFHPVSCLPCVSKLSKKVAVKQLIYVTCQLMT